MKIVQINVTCGTGSTGKICVGISNALNEHGIENYILYSSGYSGLERGVKYTNNIYIKLQALISRLNGKYGFNSWYATKKLIKELTKIDPEIIHLHNLHGHNCNLNMLIKYIKKNNIKTVWTFHDCWAFTGYCPHFAFEGCNKWISECNRCPQYKKFSWLKDKSKLLYNKKRELFTSIDLTIITPSIWLRDIVRKSFLGSNNIKVINNGINLDVFKPRTSNFKEKYKIDENKCIVLGVAFDWSNQKGLDVFIELAKRINDEGFQIVLVGVNEKIEKQIPLNVVTIRKTSNQYELAEIYSAADIFLNPTREDTFPTVNIESIACGTPVITFKTGGSPEILDEKSGIILDNDSVDLIIETLVDFKNNDIIKANDCLKRAGCFNQKDKFYQYVELYNSIYKG